MLTMMEELEDEHPLSNAQYTSLPGAFGFRGRSGRVLKVARPGRGWGKYIHWMRKDVAELKRLAAKSAPVSSMARRLNRSARAIRSRASREGISLTDRVDTQS